MAGPPWGWWRDAGERSREGALVVADWMDEQGFPTWAAWFRSEAPDRFAQFFGDGAPGLAERVFCGAIPVASPPTGFDGPWFAAVHVVSRGPGTFDFRELAEVPCMARVADLVVHGTSADEVAAGPPPDVPLALSEAAPLAGTLTGLWVLDGHVGPDGLADLPRLASLQGGLGPGRWSHPTLRHLVLTAISDAASLALPALRSLDLDLGEAHVDVAAVLSDLPSLEQLEVDAPLVPQVAASRHRGAIPRLRELHVWGAAGPVDGVRTVQRSLWPRPGMRLTSPWLFDWGIVLPP